MKQIVMLLCLMLAVHIVRSQVRPSLPKPYKVPQPDILKLDTTNTGESRKYWEDRIREQFALRGNLRSARRSHPVQQGQVYLLDQDQMPCLKSDTDSTAPMPNGWRPNRYIQQQSFPNSLQ